MVFQSSVYSPEEMRTNKLPPMPTRAPSRSSALAPISAIKTHPLSIFSHSPSPCVDSQRLNLAQTEAKIAKITEANGRPLKLSPCSVPNVGLSDQSRGQENSCSKATTDGTSREMCKGKQNVGATALRLSLLDDEDDAELVAFTDPAVVSVHNRPHRIPPIVCPQAVQATSTASSPTLFRSHPSSTRRSSDEFSSSSGSPVSTESSPRHPATLSRPVSPTDEKQRLPRGGLHRQSLTPRKIWNLQHQQGLSTSAKSPPETARHVFAPQSIAASSLESCGSQPWQHAVLEACIVFSSESMKLTGRI